VARGFRRGTDRLAGKLDSPAETAKIKPHEDRDGQTQPHRRTGNEGGRETTGALAGTAFVNNKDVIKKFILGFFNPSLFGVYVLIAGVSGIIFVTCYFGYGCWYRIGGLLFVVFVPTIFVLLLAVILAGRLQNAIWMRLIGLPKPNESEMPLLELFWRACLILLLIPTLCAKLGGEFPEARSEKICGDCEPLIADLQTKKKSLGFYPTNAVELVKSNTVLRRRYFFYYGQPNTNGVDWTPDKVVESHVSFFVTTNSFQCIVPIEKISPVSFSSFYVFSYSSENPAWNKVLLHWSPLGAYIDEPTQ
jgi:hypothetical protein